MGNFKTIFELASAEDMIEKSRFIAYAKPIKTEAEATTFIEEIKKKHWDATHNVPVYVLGEHYNIQRYSDDGEPSGTAGVPILSMIKNEGLTDLVVVVTRYFGGVKLGTGGLVRAYTQCAKLGLEAAKIIEKILYHQISVTMEYHLHGKIQNYLMGESDLIIEGTDYAEKVCLQLFIQPDLMETICEKLTDLCSGQLEIVKGDSAYLSVYEGRILEKTMIEA